MSNKKINSIVILVLLLTFSPFFLAYNVNVFPIKKESPLPDYIVSQDKLMSDIYYETGYVDEIPILCAYKNNGKKKPVAIVAHGYGSSKFGVISMVNRFAAYGYYAVALDAYGHGERANQLPIKSFPEILTMYPGDIEKVVNSLKRNSQADLNNLVMMGNSMGACAIYSYAVNSSIKPKVITPLLGTPYYEQLINHGLSTSYRSMSLENNPNLTREKRELFLNVLVRSPISQEDANKLLTEISPYKNYTALRDISILMQSGSADKSMVSIGNTMLYEDLTALGAKDVHLIVHEGLEHKITNELTNNAFNFIRKRVKP